MTVEQVVQILDETVDWYRTLGTQQQAATQPSDLLIVYANRQTADKVMALAFEIARANAELISSEDSQRKARRMPTSQAQSLQQSTKKLDEQRAAMQDRHRIGAAPARRGAPAGKGGAAGTTLRAAATSSTCINARRNLLGNMAQFENESDDEGFGANALKAHIDAIAASIPAASGRNDGELHRDGPLEPEASNDRAASRSANSASGISPRRCSDCPRRCARSNRSTDAPRSCRRSSRAIRTPPLEQLKALTARGDALGAQADTPTARRCAACAISSTRSRGCSSRPRPFSRRSARQACCSISIAAISRAGARRPNGNTTRR